MSWEISAGIIVIAGAYALVQFSKQLKPNENASTTQKGIVFLFKTISLYGALLISAVGVGMTPNVVEASITPTNSSLIQTVQTQTTVIYKAQMLSFTIFGLFLFLLVLIVIFGNLQGGKQ